jgi:lactate permease
VTAEPALAAVFTFNWLSASGVVHPGRDHGGALPGRRPELRSPHGTAKQLAFPMLTIASMLALAYLMNYSGMTTTLGLAFAATGGASLFSSLLMVGVFLTEATYPRTR